MRPILTSTVVFVLALIALGGIAMFASGSGRNDGLESGTYTTVEEAENAVGFTIPHAA